MRTQHGMMEGPVPTRSPAPPSRSPHTLHPRLNGGPDTFSFRGHYRRTVATALDRHLEERDPVNLAHARGHAPSASGAAAGNPAHALRLTRGIALAWICVCAANPLFHAVGWTALNKEVRATDPLASWLASALIPLAALALAAPLLLHTLVLRRMLPARPWWRIAIAMFLAWMAGAIAVGPLLHMALALVRSMQSLARVQGGDLTALPWMSAAGLLPILAVSGVLLPAWVFARMAHVRPAVALRAVIGASLVVAPLWVLWAQAGVDVELLSRSAMNGWTWQKRASAVLSQALAQAIWAAAALLIFARGVGAPQAPWLQSPGQYRRLAAAALVGAVLVPVVVAALGPRAAERLQLAVQRAFSPPPDRDESEGEPLLQYAYSVPVRVRETPRRASVSPDGRWIIAVARDRQVIAIDAATGAIAHRLQGGLGAHESPDWAWSPDGRWLALRTQGDRAAGARSRHQAALRLYAVPGFVPAGEHRHTGDECHADSVSFQDAVQFTQDGATLWFACGSEYRPTAANLLAVELQVPSLKVLAQRRYGDAAPWHVRGLKQVGGSVWSWHTDQQPPYVRFRDLARDDVPIVLQPPPDGPGLPPDGTLQGFAFDQAEGVARFNAWKEERQRLRTFDMRTGRMVSLVDGPLPPGHAGYSIESIASGLRVERRAHPASRAGELLAVDAASGRVRQRIRTVVQYPLAFSPDGRLLVTQAQDELRVYRVQQAPGHQVAGLSPSPTNASTQTPSGSSGSHSTRGSCASPAATHCAASGPAAGIAPRSAARCAAPWPIAVGRWRTGTALHSPRRGSQASRPRAP